MWRITNVRDVCLITSLAIAATFRAGTSEAASLGHWEFYGPKDCDSEPYGAAGRTLCMCITPTLSGPGVVYAGHSSGGLWSSSDNGASWQVIKDGPVGAIAYRQRAAGLSLDTDRLIVGTGEWNKSYDQHQPGDGIWYSNDLGTTWAHPLVWPESINRGVSSIAVAVDHSTVFAGTNSGVYRDVAGGTAWNESARLTNCEVSDVIAHPTDPNKALLGAYSTAAGAPKGVYRTTDKGTNWIPVFGPTQVAWLSPNLWGRTILAQSMIDPNKVYARVVHKLNSSDPRDEHIALIAVSNDAGLTWSIVWSEQSCGVCVTSDHTFCCLGGAGGRSSFGAGRYADQSGTTREYLLCGGQLLHVSLDGGVTWSPHLGGHNDFHHVEIADDGAWIATDGGPYFYYPPSSGYPNGRLERRSNGLNTLQFESVAVDPTLDTGAMGAIVYGGTQDQGTWGKNGHGGGAQADWENITSHSDGFSVAASDNCLAGSGPNADAVYWWIGRNNIGRSCNRGIQISGCPTQDWGPILLDPFLPNSFVWYFAGPALGRLAGANPCGNYEQVGNPLTDNCGAAAIMVTNGGQRRIYAGTRQGHFHVIDDMGTQSTPGPWFATEITAGWTPWVNKLSISDIAIAPPTQNEGESVYLTLAPAATKYSGVWSHAYNMPTGNVWKYNSSGWQPVGVGLPKEPFYSVLVDPADRNHVYVGGSHAVYHSVNGGTTWSKVLGDLPDVMIYDLAMHPGERSLFAATHGRSVYKTFPDSWQPYDGNVLAGPGEVRALGTGPVVRAVQVGDKLKLESGQRGRVSISVHDVQGRFVAALFDGTVEEETRLLDLTILRGPGRILFARIKFEGRQVGSARVVLER